MTGNYEIGNFPDTRGIFRLTDCTGMFQHSVYCVPDPGEGYTTDDNARALIMSGLLYKCTSDSRYLDLALVYLRFMIYAQKNGWFRNFMDYSRNFHEEKGSQDCFGRCVMALGFTSSFSAFPDGVKDAALKLFEKVSANCGKLEFIKSKAYAVIGLSRLKDKRSRDMLIKLADDMLYAYKTSSSPDFEWFEDKITYCGAVLPWAMLEAYDAVKNKDYLNAGVESLNFLIKHTFKDGIFTPVGCCGWFQKGKQAALFDQQPVEACATLLACLKGHEITSDKAYLEHAGQCLDWYTGKNILGIPLINQETGGCMDGLTPKGANRNEGAESIVSWITASISLAAIT